MVAAVAGSARDGYGAYLDWTSLKATLRLAILKSTEQELDRVADHLEIVADDFEKTDAQIRAELEAHAEQVDKEDEPTPRTDRRRRAPPDLGQRQLIPPSKARTAPVIIRAGAEAR